MLNPQKGGGTSGPPRIKRIISLELYVWLTSKRGSTQKKKFFDKIKFNLHIVLFAFICFFFFWHQFRPQDIASRTRNITSKYKHYYFRGPAFPPPGLALLLLDLYFPFQNLHYHLQGPTLLLLRTCIFTSRTCIIASEELHFPLQNLYYCFRTCIFTSGTCIITSGTCIIAFGPALCYHNLSVQKILTNGRKFLSKEILISEWTLPLRSLLYAVPLF